MALQLLQEEGVSNTGVGSFKEWLNKWNFTNVDSVKTALCEQGIESSENFKEFVVNEKTFEKLVDRLKVNFNLNFRDEIALESAWKSLQTEDNEKIVFLGDAERKIMDDLNAKYENVSKEVATLQEHTGNVEKNKDEMLRILDENAQKMIKIIEENQDKIRKEIEAEINIKNEDLMHSLKILMAKRTICAQRKEEFGKIALDKNIEKNAKLQKLQSLLVIEDEQKTDKVELGLINILPFDEAAFDENVYSLLSAKNDDENIKFSAKHGDVGCFKVSNNGKTVTVKEEDGATVFCENGFNAGIHSWKVKCESGNYYPWIGIMNTLEEEVDGKGIAYMWEVDYIYGNKDGKELFETNIGKEWETGSIVTVTLNCDKWVLTFLHNNEYVKKIDIEPNQTYYPVFAGDKGTTLTIVE